MNNGIISLNIYKQFELFMNFQNSRDPQARKFYLKKFEDIRKGAFIRIEDFEKRYRKFEWDMICGKNVKKFSQKEAVEYLKSL